MSERGDAERSADLPAEERFRILCVCTGNVYRSRAAAAALERGLVERLGARASSFEVTSAGTRPRPSGGLLPEELAAYERLGRQVVDAPVRGLDAADVVRADLVLCADRAHRTAVLELVPSALRRTYLVGELARLVGPAHSRIPSPDSSATDRARAVLTEAAKLRGSIGQGGGANVVDDAVADPWGHPDAVLESALRRIEDAVGELLDGLVGPAEPAGERTAPLHG